MEDSQENLTTRSLLKGILATENVRPAVTHQTKSTSRASVSRIHQDKTPASPSMTLRSQMKSRVRRSLGKLALEDSYMKRHVNAEKNTKKKPAIKEFNNIVEELNNITPQSLLRRIIQNEDEVSIVVSQRSKAAVDHTEEEGAHETEQRSLSNINLSLPDQQDTEPLDVFRATRRKRRMNSSQFEREVDEKLPKNRDSCSLKENIEDFGASVNTIEKTRYFEDQLDFSVDPQFTYKRALLRKPNKAFLVSLGDFEQGVEDKYHLIKGSQECFIESIVGDTSTISTRGVAELNTELYVPPLLSESNTLSSENRLMSNSLVSSDKQKGVIYKGIDDMSLAKMVENKNISPIAVLQGTDITEVMGETAKNSKITSNIWQSVPVVDVEHSATNERQQKSLLVGEEENKFESDQNLSNSVSVMENVDNFGSKQKQAIRKSVSMIKDSERESIENSVGILRNSSPLQLHQSLSKSLPTDKDYNPNKPYLRMQKSELVECNNDSFNTNINKDGEMMKTADIAKCEPLQTMLAETRREPERDRLSHKINYSALNKENDNKYTTSLNISSTQEDNSESSQVHNREDLLQGESTMEGDAISPEHQAKVNKPSLISGLIETPAYIRNARLKFPPNKLVAGKKVHKKATVRTKKDTSPFKSSLVKHLFNLHAKMRISKEASTDVENFLEIFLDQMTGDLAAYAAHANRKTITLSDLELLMKRQRLVTDASSFNVLIERHLPLECRKLLIPCAMGGNKVFPKM